MKKLAVLGVVALGWSCTAQPAAQNISHLQLENLVRSRGVAAPSIVVPYHLTREMKQWAHDHVPRTLTSDEQRLLHQVYLYHSTAPGRGR